MQMQREIAMPVEAPQKASHLPTAPGNLKDHHPNDDVPSTYCCHDDDKPNPTQPRITIPVRTHAEIETIDATTARICAETRYLSL